MAGCTDSGFAELADRYSSLAEPVIRHGRAYPAAIEARPGGAIDAAVTAAGDADLDSRLRDAGQAHLDRQVERNPGMHDGVVLALDSALGGELVLRRSSYFAMVATCDALRAEYEAGGEMPIRELAESLAAPDPLRIGAGRVAAVGVTVAVTCRAGAGRSLLIGRRRTDLAADPGRWDVAPSGMVEPVPVGSEPIRHSAQREIEEELGGLWEEGELRMVGLAFDLLRLKPDVVLELEVPEARYADLALSSSEFESTASVDLSPAGIESFWSDHGPDSLSATAAATVAMLEPA